MCLIVLIAQNLDGARRELGSLLEELVLAALLGSEPRVAGFIGAEAVVGDGTETC